MTPKGISNDVPPLYHKGCQWKVLMFSSLSYHLPSAQQGQDFPNLRILTHITIFLVH